MAWFLEEYRAMIAETKPQKRISQAPPYSSRFKFVELDSLRPGKIVRKVERFYPPVSMPKQPVGFIKPKKYDFL